MNLGPYNFPKGAALAPMAGITNPPFRRLCIEQGAIFTVTELISCHAIVYLAGKQKNRTRKRGLKTISLLEPFTGEYPFVVQLYGRDPSVMAEAARIVEGEGAHIIDLNFGCPAKKVVKDGQGAGVALMLNPSMIGTIAHNVVESVSIPVTAKTRLGYSQRDKNGVEVIKTLEDNGVSLVTVHARTREQGHSGPIDLVTLGEMVSAVKIPVIGNGGIFNGKDAIEMQRETGCAAVAIGQGAKGNPWIFGEITGRSEIPSLLEKVATCRRHLELYVQWIGEDRSVLEMRKHACWYLKGFEGAAAFRKRLGEAVSSDAFNRLLDEVPV